MTVADSYCQTVVLYGISFGVMVIPGELDNQLRFDPDQTEWEDIVEWDSFMIDATPEVRAALWPPRAPRVEENLDEMHARSVCRHFEAEILENL